MDISRQTACVFAITILITPTHTKAHDLTPPQTNDLEFQADIQAHLNADHYFEGAAALHQQLQQDYERYDYTRAAPILKNNDSAAERAEAPSGNEHLVGRWSPVFEWPVVGIFNALMPNGKVLAWDSVGDAAAETIAVHDRTRAAVWDPATNTHTRVDVIGENIFCAGYSHLPDGSLFTAGGNLNAALDGIRSTYTFNPFAPAWRRGPDMQQGRWYPSVTPLANGELLITAGGPNLAEVRQTDGTLRTLSNARLGLPSYPWMQVAPNGTVFYAGPSQALRSLDTSGAGAWQSHRDRDDVFRTYGSYAMFDIGKILVAGGEKSVKSAYVLDINDDTPGVSRTADMANGRRQHNLTVLADGSVLATGGNNNGAAGIDKAASVYTAELWLPNSGTWRTLASNQRPRQYHSTALLLPDGRVLSSGGGICGDCLRIGYLERNAEIFSPPYLFKKDGSGQLATRPSIASVYEQIGYDQPFAITTAQANRIAKVALVRLSSVTHSVDQEQRYVPLTFTRGDGILSARAPVNANIAPPGYYMLFIIDSDGVPSVAKMVQVLRTSSDAALVGWWNFDEGSGNTAVDTSGYNNNGEMRNDADFGAGKVRNALNLRGTNNSYVRIPRSSSLDTVTSRITAMAWAYPNARTGDFTPLLTRQHLGVVHPDQYYLGFGNGQFKWHVGTSTQETSCYWGAMPAGRWVHLAGTYDGAQLRLYVDGVEVCNQPLSGNIPIDGNPVTIGAEENGPDHDPVGEFNGRIDDVRLYRRVLSASEIASYVRSIGNPPPTPTPTPTPIAQPPTPTPTPRPNLGCSDNLLIDPSYEGANAAAVWNGSIALINDAQHGNYAARLSPIGGSGQLVSVNGSVAGRSFGASVWRKIGSGLPDYSLGLAFYDANYAPIGNETTAHTIGPTYAQHSVSGIAPANTAYVGVFVYNGGGGDVIIDNWCLRQSPSPAPNPLPNGWRVYLPLSWRR